MKNKQIFLCFGNKKLIQKDETKITYDDIDLCEYFMIPVNTIDGCYTLVKPNKYLLFTNGIVQYQFCVIDQDIDFGHVVYEPSIFVKTEITSICDLIGLINSIDKITIANYITTEDYITDSIFAIGILSMDIQLFNEDKLIYSKNFRIKGTITNGFDPYKVNKCFSDIYDSSICGTLFMNNKYFIIEQKKNVLKWNISKSYDTSGFVGVPLMSSNTLVFCTPSQLEKLIDYNRLDIYTFIYYENNDFIGDISEAIVNGCSYCELEKKIGYINDVYYDTHKIISNYYKKPWTRLLEIVVHSFFCLNLIYIIFKNLYDQLPFDENGNLISDTHDFDIIITIQLFKRNSNVKSGKEFSINKYSLLRLEDILSNL